MPTCPNILHLRFTTDLADTFRQNLKLHESRDGPWRYGPFRLYSARAAVRHSGSGRLRGVYTGYTGYTGVYRGVYTGITLSWTLYLAEFAVFLLFSAFLLKRPCFSGLLYRNSRKHPNSAENSQHHPSSGIRRPSSVAHRPSSVVRRPSSLTRRNTFVSFSVLRNMRPVGSAGPWLSKSKGKERTLFLDQHRKRVLSFS